MLKINIEHWCKYGNDRSEQNIDLTQTIATLQQLYQQSLQYSFPPRIQHWFHVNHNNLQNLSEQEISYRIRHANLLLKNARSLNMRLNKITNYFSSSTSSPNTSISSISHKPTPHRSQHNHPSKSSTSTLHQSFKNKSKSTSYSPYKYVRNVRRTNTASIHNIKIIRVSRNKYRKFRLIHHTYVKKSKLYRMKRLRYNTIKKR